MSRVTASTGARLSPSDWPGTLPPTTLAAYTLPPYTLPTTVLLPYTLPRSCARLSPHTDATSLGGAPPPRAASALPWEAIAECSC